MATTYALIGYPLSHSFSAGYFAKKFLRLGLNDYTYQLKPLQTLADLNEWVASQPDLKGFNVTIPHKESIIAYLDQLSPEAEAIGAVNTVTVNGGKLTGYNTDAHGFKISLESWIRQSENPPERSIVLGTGGASKAVQFVLRQLGIPFLTVSRHQGKGDILWSEITPNLLQTHRLVVNTTPLGMSPHISGIPPLPYEAIGLHHWLYDLVYNPPQTAFLLEGSKRGAKTKNGMEMLELQAERAWEIWEFD